MSFLRPLLLGLLLGCSFIAPVSAAEPPSAKAVQQSLDALADRNLPEAEHNALKTRLEQTLARIADSPVVDYFRTLGLNPLSPLRGEAFRPDFAEADDSVQLALAIGLVAALVIAGVNTFKKENAK